MTKATTVGDVLAVQAQLDTIESQLEQLQGQLQVLTSETSYSTLTANVSEGAPPSPPSPLPESGMVRAWHDSVGGFLAGVEGVVRVAGPVLFALLCLAAARGRRPGPVAALSATPPLVPVAQSPIAAAKGIPGIVTTPTPPDGPTSSLTAIVPVGAHDQRFERGVREAAARDDHGCPWRDRAGGEQRSARRRDRFRGVVHRKTRGVGEGQRIG